MRRRCCCGGGINNCDAYFDALAAHGWNRTQGNVALNISGSTHAGVSNGSWSLPPLSSDDYRYFVPGPPVIDRWILLACDQFGAGGRVAGIHVDGWFGEGFFDNAAFKQFPFPINEADLFGATFTLDQTLVANTGIWTVTLPP